MRMAKDDTKTLSCLRSSAKESFMSRIAAFFKRGKKEECRWNWRRFFAILRDAKEFEEEMTMYRKRHRTQKAKKAFTPPDASSKVVLNRKTLSWLNPPARKDLFSVTET